MPLARAEVEDEFTPFVDDLTDFTEELQEVLADASDAMDAVEFHLEAGSPPDLYSDEYELVKDFTSILDRIKVHLDELEPKIEDWHDHYDNFTPYEQERIDEVVSLVERLELIYDGYYFEAMELLERYKTGEEAFKERYWTLRMSGDVMLADGKAYGSPQDRGDFRLTAKWERSDGILLEITERIVNDRRFVKSRSFITETREKFPTEGGNITLRQRFENVKGLDEQSIDRTGWRIEFDWDQNYGDSGSYFRLNGRLQERDFDNTPARSYDYFRAYGFLHHEVGKRHSAEIEYDRYDFDFGNGSIISHYADDLRLGWETSVGAGWVISADYSMLDKVYDVSPSLSYTEDRLDVAARLDYSEEFRFDLRYRDIANDRNNTTTLPGLNDYDETRWETRIYFSPWETVDVNFRGVFRNKDYTLENPLELDEEMLNVRVNFYPTRRLRMFVEGEIDDFEYLEDALSFRRQKLRTGFTYRFGNYSNVGFEYTITDQEYASASGRDFSLNKVQVSYNKFWKKFRLRVMGSISELSQDDPSSINLYDTDKISAELAWRMSANTRLTLGADYLNREYDNQPDVRDWLLYARLGFNF